MAWHGMSSLKPSSLHHRPRLDQWSSRVLRPEIASSKMPEFKNMRVFPKIDVPQKWMVYSGKPYEQMDDLGVFSYFWKHPCFRNCFQKCPKSQWKVTTYEKLFAFRRGCVGHHFSTLCALISQKNNMWGYGLLRNHHHFLNGNHRQSPPIFHQPFNLSTRWRQETAHWSHEKNPPTFHWILVG